MRRRPQAARVVAAGVAACAVAASVAACAVAAFGLAGCSNAPIEVQLRVPGGDHPLAGADVVSLSLRDAAGALLAFARMPATASSLALAPVAAGSGYTVEVDATFRGDVIARGRSCAFDVDASRPPTVALWFSSVGRFAPTAGPTHGRDGANLFAWGAGALLAGGDSDGSAQASTETYDPSTGRFADGPLLATARAGARAVDLGDGTVLLLGGAAQGAPALEALTASHTTPEPAGFAPDIVEHAVARTAGGDVVLIGGRVGGAATDAAWLVRQAGARVNPLPAMAHARAGATLSSASSDAFAPLYVIGGVDAAGAPVGEVELYDPTHETFAGAGFALAMPRSGHTVTRLPTGLLLVVGGVDAAGAPIAAAELVDPVNRAARTVAMLRVARARHAATLLPSGRVLVSGGIGADGAALADAEIFDPSLGPEGDFVPTAPLSSARADHELVRLCDGTWLVAGGGSGAEIYNPL